MAKHQYLIEVYRRYLATKYLKERTKSVQEAAEAYAKSAIVPSYLGAKVREVCDRDRELSRYTVIGEIVREASS